MDAVIFDLDDTLIVEEETARASLAEALALTRAMSDRTGATAADVDIALGCARRHWSRSRFAGDCRRLGIASWEGLWATCVGCHRSLAGLAEWVPDYRRAAWADILRAFDDDPDRSAEVGACYVAAQRRGHPPIVSAIEAAEKMGAVLPTGVVTNGPPDIQRLKLSRTGLEFPAGHVVISGEVGVGKPDAAVFSLALDRLGSTAAATVMVGDSWSRDILGALAVGMRAVWVSKGRQPPAALAELGSDVLVVDQLTPEAFDRF